MEGNLVPFLKNLNDPRVRRWTPGPGIRKVPQSPPDCVLISGMDASSSGRNGAPFVRHAAGGKGFHGRAD